MKILIIRHEDESFEIGIDGEKPKPATAGISGKVVGAGISYEYEEFEVETGKDGEGAWSGQ